MQDHVIDAGTCLSPFFVTQQTCAVCLEDFKVKDELGVLPCQHAFHRKWVQESLSEFFFSFLFFMGQSCSSWPSAVMNGEYSAAACHCRSSCSTSPTVIHSSQFKNERARTIVGFCMSPLMGPAISRREACLHPGVLQNCHTPIFPAAVFNMKSLTVNRGRFWMFKLK